MWSVIFIAGTLLVLMNACGSSQPLLAARDKPNEVAKQAYEPASPILQRLRMQADRGNVEAQFAIAEAYDRGRDVPKDKTEAVRWYRLAALQGDAFAQNALADNYWEGTGLPKDDREAAKWWQLAASQGFAPAQHSLGKILSGGGQGVRSDRIQAYMWLALSAAQGDGEASRQSNLLAKQLGPSEMAQAKKLITQWKPIVARTKVNKILQ
jgi:TPR repeat protein